MILKTTLRYHKGFDALKTCTKQSLLSLQVILQSDDEEYNEHAPLPRHESEPMAHMEDDNIDEMLADWFPAVHAMPNVEHDIEYTKLSEEASTPIYNGSSLSRLSTTLLILNLQAKYGWSNTSVSALLK